MASIADINIRIGAQIQGLVKGLNTAERRLQRSASRFSRIGNELSLSVSLPLVAIGRQAISAASDFDRLEKALNTITGSAGETARLFKQLEEDAKAPGVEIEGLVKGIVRLANTGQSVEQARRAMNQFGNAIALAGGTASDLDGVSLALTQIIAKGKISAEEINQLGERVPQVRKAIQDAFGTADSKALQKAGISAEEFVEKITDEFAKLPRAQSGLANALNNTSQVIRRNFANIGKEVDQAFNLTGNLEKFANSLTQLTDRFSSLDTGTKRFILTTAGLVAGIGPAIKLFSVFKTAQLAMISSFKSLVVGIKNFSGGVLLLTQRFIALNAVSKATIVGLAAVAIGGAILLWNKYRDSIAETTAAQNALKEVQSQAVREVAREKVAVDQLIAVIKNENTTKRERKEAIEELQSISPQYFGNLNTEKALISEVTAASEAYVDSLTRRARATAAQQKLVEIEGELLDIAQQYDQADPTFFQTLGNFAKSFGNTAAFAGNQVNTLLTNLEKNRSVLEAQKEALIGVIQETEDYTRATNAAAGATARQRNAATGAGTGSGVLSRDNIDLEDNGGTHASTFRDQLEVTEQLRKKHLLLGNQLKISTDNMSQQDVAFQKLSAQFEIASAKADVFGSQQTLLSEKIRLTTEAINLALEQGFSPTSTVVGTLTEQLALFSEQLQQIAEGPLVGIQDIIKGATSAITQMAASGETSFARLGKAALSGAADVARAKLIEATTSYIADSFTKFGIFGALLAAGAGAIVGGLFNRVIAGLKIPALAEGGLAFGPSLALIGDNPNARLDPEVVAPLSKLKALVGSGQSDGQLLGEVVIRGQDMALLIRRQGRDQNRF